MVKKVINHNKVEQEMPLDFKFILEELEGDNVLFFGIVDRFLHKVKIELTSLRNEIASYNSEAIVFIAHSIRGGASNLGLFKLAKLAFQLEKVNLTKNFSLQENYKISKELAAELDYLTTYISDYL